KAAPPVKAASASDAERTLTSRAGWLDGEKFMDMAVKGNKTQGTCGVPRRRRRCESQATSHVVTAVPTMPKQDPQRKPSRPLPANATELPPPLSGRSRLVPRSPSVAAHATGPSAGSRSPWTPPSGPSLPHTPRPLGHRPPIGLHLQRVGRRGSQPPI